MARVQRAAALQITGALRSSPNDSLNIHADLLPLQYVVRTISYRANLRMAALPSSHPLYRPIQTAARRYIKTHRSLLHELTGVFRVKPDEVETITPTHHDSCVVFQVETSLEGEAEEITSNTAADYVCNEPVRIYTDGSGIDNTIGRAAVLPGKPPYKSIHRYCLGSDSHHTVYKGEAVGLLLALELIKVNSINQHTVILLDNQAVIAALSLRRQAPGHYLIDWFHDELRRLKEKPRHKNLEVEVTWVQGHKGNTGNESADQEAKRAARGKVSQLSHLPKCLQKPLPHSVSAMKQAQHTQTKKRVAADLAKSHASKS